MAEIIFVTFPILRHVALSYCTNFTDLTSIEKQNRLILSHANGSSILTTCPCLNTLEIVICIYYLEFRYVLHRNL